MGMLKNVRETVVSALGLTSEDNTPKVIGIYGPPNAGKTTLANKMSIDFGEGPIGPSGEVPHETREVVKKDGLVIENEQEKLTIDITDTPGIDTKVDVNEFIEDYNMDDDASSERAREATEGITEAIQWLRSDIDGVIYMMDATQNPHKQVNTMTLGIIESEDIPVLVIANKIDLDEANAEQIRETFPQHKTVEISAKEGKNINTLYNEIINHFGGDNK